MKQEYCIELLEEYENVNFYSIRMAGKELMELEAFFEKFPEGCEYDDEIDVIISWIDQDSCLWQWRCKGRENLAGK